MHAFKLELQQASAAAGLYALHLPHDEGGGGLDLLDMYYVQEEVFRHGVRGVQWLLGEPGRGRLSPGCVFAVLGGVITS